MPQLRSSTLTSRILRRVLSSTSGCSQVALAMKRLLFLTFHPAPSFNGRTISHMGDMARACRFSTAGLQADTLALRPSYHDCLAKSRHNIEMIAVCLTATCLSDLRVFLYMMIVGAGTGTR